MNPEDRAYALVKQAILQDALQRLAVGAARLRRLGRGAEFAIKAVNQAPKAEIVAPLTQEQEQLQRQMQMAQGFYTPGGY